MKEDWRHEAGPATRVLSFRKITPSARSCRILLILSKYENVIYNNTLEHVVLGYRIPLIRDMLKKSDLSSGACGLRRGRSFLDVAWGQYRFHAAKACEQVCEPG
jgi:hypothetical protein